MGDFQANSASSTILVRVYLCNFNHHKTTTQRLSWKLILPHQTWVILPRKCFIHCVRAYLRGGGWAADQHENEGNALLSFSSPQRGNSPRQVKFPRYILLFQPGESIQVNCDLCTCEEKPGTHSEGFFIKCIPVAGCTTTPGKLGVIRS